VSMAKIKPEYTEADVLEALALQHPGPEKWVFLTHVPDATSWDKSRTADAIAVGCWRSVGLRLHGYEVKVSRSDWLREIQQPEKSEQFAALCHYWWIAAPPGVVELEEMPANWGLRVVQRTGEDNYSARVKKAATFNEGAMLDYGFFAACLRVAAKRSPERKSHAEALAAEFQRGQEDGRDDAKWQINNLTEALERHNKTLAEFEDTSGLHISSWDAGRIGEALRAFMQLKSPQTAYRNLIETLDDMRTNAQHCLDALTKQEPAA
jgi:hypothetical protein